MAATHSRHRCGNQQQAESMKAAHSVSHSMITVVNRPLHVLTRQPGEGGSMSAMAMLRQLAACYACNHGGVFMSHRLTAALVFLFLTVCVGQAGTGFEAIVDLQLVHRSLGKAQVRGSLAYSSCGFNNRVPDDLPRMRVLPDYSGPPKNVLQKIFADDPAMHVTQEEGGTIRMIETDVPTDLLNLKIRHLSFYPSDV